MTPHETNGRLKLTWAQVVWVVSMFLMLAGMWARMEVRFALLEATVQRKADSSEVEQIRHDLVMHARGDRRLVPEAEAGTLGNPSGSR